MDKNTFEEMRAALDDLEVAQAVEERGRTNAFDEAQAESEAKKLQQLPSIKPSKEPKPRESWINGFYGNNGAHQDEQFENIKGPDAGLDEERAAA